MSRFAEEHYATRSHKAFTRRKNREEDPVEADKRESRTQHFQKPLSVRKAIAKAQSIQGRLDFGS